MKLNNFDLNKIYIFQAVMKHGGYGAASEELHLTKSALSQSITALETSLGVRLFQRVGKRLSPTPQAQRFYEEVKDYQVNLQNSVLKLIGNTGRVEGNLKIGAYLEFAKSKLMPIIEELLEQNPKSQISFYFESPSRLNYLLESGKIDLSISVFPHQKSKAIVSRRLYQEELVLVGSPNLVPERPKRDHFESVPVIDYFSKHQAFQRWWKLHFHPKQFRGAVRAYAATAEMVLELCERGLGVGVVPRYVYEGQADFERLRIIQPSEKRLYDHIWLNELRDKSKSLMHEAFLRELSTSFSGLAD